MINSINNKILNNTILSTDVGIYINGTSNNNTINYNLAQTSLDYECSSQNSAINAESGGIDYGVTKQNCIWLAALPTTAPNVQCAATNNPTVYTLTSDYLYQYGATCFGLNLGSNGTTINCQGHTIIALNGGTFARIVSSPGSLVENCYLKDFTSPVTIMNSSAKVYNNTIYMNSSSIAGIAVNVSNSINAHVEDNIIQTPYYGVSFTNVSSGTIEQNYVIAYVDAYSLKNSDGTVVSNNQAPYPGTIGFSLTNSTINNFNNNNFDGTDGLLCKGTSATNSSNVDLGGNACTANLNCKWISASQTSCH